MPKLQRLFPLISIAVLTLGSASVAFSDSDDDRGYGGRERQEHEGRGGWLRSRADVPPVNNPTYSEECGACHMAYQPGLLPADAWARIMSPEALTDHYGDDASLAEDLRRQIADYLTGGAAGGDSWTRSRAFAVSMSGGNQGTGSTLPRISQTAYFVRKHDEIPPRMVKDNPEVGSFSQCNSCHRGAAKGVYNEHQVSIPGYGSWED